MVLNRPDSIRRAVLMRSHSTWSYDESLRHYRPESGASNTSRLSTQSTESGSWIPMENVEGERPNSSIGDTYDDICFTWFLRDDGVSHGFWATGERS
ncbi:unnamed protein product [Bursaphelenchus okinawaensis]|uniref:Uncharacterized protein n=1 Tax=Bursaphelenchus okinawaensis TaxID=465554 RepID=A0A811KNN7_9BILA|nr:unnamed protein product [Bursaphelenchus okinawaensis]CAG9107490.1 unnamed protein product [Bursaphelenchus okinawaensis]